MFSDHDKTSSSIAASSVGSLFHARGAATEKALSPIRRRVRGTTRLPHDEARSVDRPGTKPCSCPFLIIKLTGSNANSSLSSALFFLSPSVIPHICLIVITHISVPSRLLPPAHLVFQLSAVHRRSSESC